jgi:hypothetical protein
MGGVRFPVRWRWRHISCCEFRQMMMSDKSRLNILMRAQISYIKWAFVWGALEMLRMNILSVAPFGLGGKKKNRRWHI